MIGGDPADLRADATRERAWADELDDDARAVLRAQDVEWVSTAADRFREKLEERRREVEGVAADYRDVADRLDALADTLDERQRTLTNLLETAGRTLEEVQQAVADGAQDLMSAAEGFANDALQAGKDAVDGLVDGGKKVLDRIGL